jgi:hypothetical protein
MELTAEHDTSTATTTPPTQALGSAGTVLDHVVFPTFVFTSPLGGDGWLLLAC